jgi:hypothetical protein
MRLQKYKDAIGIPGSTLGNFGSLARLSLRNPKDLQIGAILSAGPAAVSSAYTFPCKIYGNTAVGWPQNRGACAQGLWVVPRVQSFGVQPPGSRNANTAAATKNLLKAQFSFDQVQYYCGVVADSGTGQWSISTGLSSLEDTCQTATQQCLQASAGSGCSVVSLGDWAVSDPDLMVSIQCANNLNPKKSAFTRRSKGSEVITLLSQLEQMSRSNNRINCVPSVYHPDELIVSPAKDELTLIQTKDLNGSLEIDVLVGSVYIISARRPNNVLVEKGFSYRLPDDTQAPLNCTGIFQSLPVQDFLNPANWPQEVSTQLQGYRQGFCQSRQRPRNGPGTIIIPIPFPRPSSPGNNGTPPSDNGGTPPPDNGGTPVEF